METHPGEGVVKFPHSRKPSHRQVCGGFWNFKRATKLGEKKKNPTEYVPNHNCQRRSCPDT